MRVIETESYKQIVAQVVVPSDPDAEMEQQDPKGKPWGPEWQMQPHQQRSKQKYRTGPKGLLRPITEVPPIPR